LGKGVAKTQARSSATARGSLALIESPLLQRMRQRRVSTMTTAAQRRSPHMSAGFLKATPHSALRATLGVPSLPATKRPASIGNVDRSLAAPNVSAESTLRAADLQGASSKARVVPADRVVAADDGASAEASVSRSRSRVRPSMVGSVGAAAGTSAIRSLTSSRQSVASGGRAAYSPYRRGVASGIASQKRV
jgi:hypothetical protein